MKRSLLSLIPLSFLIFSCVEGVDKTDEPVLPEDTKTEIVSGPEFKNEAHEIVYNMVQKVGDIETLKSKKDVVYTYTYQTPDGKTDSSTEKYIFEGELSYGKYQKNERTLPELEGEIEQGYDGKNFWLKHNGTVLDDTTKLKRVAFNRPTNFYWFCMLPKLMDPNVTYDYIGEDQIGDAAYDIVKVSFTSENGKPNDIYQLYINKSTLLVDQFLFTVAEFGKMEVPNLMQLKYEEIDGLMIPTIRQYKKSTWEAIVTEEPWVTVSWTNIKFNNNLTQEDFNK